MPAGWGRRSRAGRGAGRPGRPLRRGASSGASSSRSRRCRRLPGELLARGKAHRVALGQDLDVLLKAAGMDVVGQAADADQLLAVVHDTQPDVVLLDIRMPPTHTLEGLRAAREIRSAYVARVGIVLLTQYIETSYAVDLLTESAAGIGYLLKDRVFDPTDLAD